MGPGFAVDGGVALYSYGGGGSATPSSLRRLSCLIASGRVRPSSPATHLRPLLRRLWTGSVVFSLTRRRHRRTIIPIKNTAAKLMQTATATCAEWLIPCAVELSPHRSPERSRVGDGVAVVVVLVLVLLGKTGALEGTGKAALTSASSSVS